METVQEGDREEEEEGGGEKGKEGKAVRGDEESVKESALENRLEDAVEEEEGVEMRRKVDSELISNNVALIHLLKGNTGIGVMAMSRSLFYL